jgi:hypothetical protein
MNQENYDVSLSKSSLTIKTPTACFEEPIQLEWIPSCKTILEVYEHLKQALEHDQLHIEEISIGLRVSFPIKDTEEQARILITHEIRNEKDEQIFILQEQIKMLLEAQPVRLPGSTTLIPRDTTHLCIVSKQSKLVSKLMNQIFKDPSITKKGWFPTSAYESYYKTYLLCNSHPVAWNRTYELTIPDQTRVHEMSREELVPLTRCVSKLHFAGYNDRILQCDDSRFVVVHADVVNLSNVAHLTQLEELHIYNDTINQDYTFLRHLTKLKQLHICGASQLEDLTCLPPSLDELYLLYCDKIMNVPNIQRFNVCLHDGTMLRVHT